MAEKIYYTFDDVEIQVRTLARKVMLSQFRPDWVVSINRGGLVPGVMLSHYLQTGHHTLDIRLRDGGQDNTESNGWMAEEAFGYEGPPKKILVVDDINDSGATLQWLMDDWEADVLPGDERWGESVWHKSVRFACLIDNANSDFTIDYRAIDIAKTPEYDPWIVFPWEVDD